LHGWTGSRYGCHDEHADLVQLQVCALLHFALQVWSLLLAGCSSL
jgi:hypothetical protein